MGVSEKQIARINELAHKAKAEGLNNRREAGAAGASCRIHCRFQSQLKSQLDNIDIKEKDGTIVNLGEKYGAKHGKKGN